MFSFKSLSFLTLFCISRPCDILRNRVGEVIFSHRVKAGIISLLSVMLAMGFCFNLLFKVQGLSPLPSFLRVLPFN